MEKRGMKTRQWLRYLAAILWIGGFLMMGAACGNLDSDSDSEPRTEVPSDESPSDETPEAPADPGLPVVPPETATLDWSLYESEIPHEQLSNVTDGNEEGLFIDLGDPALWGRIYTSPYPFEAGDGEYDYTYFNMSGELVHGAGVLPIAGFFESRHDPNQWREGGISTATPTVAYRLELFSGTDPETPPTLLKLYGGLASFQRTDAGTFRKLPTIIEGPLVTMVASDDPRTLAIVWETDEPCSGRVIFDGRSYEQEGEAGLRHRAVIRGLAPGTEYAYHVRSDAPDGRRVTSATYRTRTAPEKGQGQVTFAYCSDSYHGGGGGTTAYMGSNLKILGRVVAGAYKNGADFFLFGGDMIEGSASDKAQTLFQYRTWKRIMGPFWHTRPVYPGMGNHEAVFNIYEGFEALDKWPYATESGEAVFASAFYNPANGPGVADPRRPSYTENVYHFQYGPVMVIAFNNTYWWSGYSADPAVNGGSPVGYIMEDQLAWIERTIAMGQADPTVRFIFLFAHAPVFPYMNHVDDGMWHEGNNNVRAYVRNPEAGILLPEARGVLEVRDRFWKAVSGASKVGAVFASHEHGYYRTLITGSTPVGVWPGDDTDGDGVLDRYSPNPDFKNPTWHITSGTGGSIYYAEAPSELTPWGAERATSHYGYVLVRTEGEKASLEFVASPVMGTGRVIDRVDDLMAGKE